LNSKEDILKNVGNQTMKVNGDQQLTLKYLLLCSTEEKLIQVWNNFRVSNRWQTFGWTIPLIVAVQHDNIDRIVGLLAVGKNAYLHITEERKRNMKIQCEINPRWTKT